MEPAELTRAALDRFVDDQVPFVRPLGITCEEIGRRSAVARLQSDPRWMRPGNIICGGMLMTLADVAIYFAILGQVGLRAMAVTNEKMSFLRPASGGDVLAGARVLKLGRRIAYGEIHLHTSDKPEALVAHATSSYVLPVE
ncbi:MAG: PaaI family thioesterase [Candidatus Methylomirabilales bacterium]